jgi:hypothetical protein
LGSRYSKLDPLNRLERTPVPELELSYYGLTEADMDREFSPGSWQGAAGPMKLRDIVANVKKTYCGTIGIEYMYISNTAEKRWIQKKFEGSLSTPTLSADQKRWILERLTAVRDARALSPYALRRAEALLRRGRRKHDPDARHRDRERRRQGRQGSRDRHGPPRPPERAGQYPRQDPRRPLLGIRGQATPTTCLPAT